MKTVTTRDASQLAPGGARRAHSTSGWLSNEETLHLCRPPAAQARAAQDHAMMRATT
jgi:hypothetical protein